jgi:hypothetical protein
MLCSALLAAMFVVALPLPASAEDALSGRDRGRAENNADADMLFFQRESFRSVSGCEGKASLQIDICWNRRLADLAL